jgi:hypothetical protein
MMEKKVKDAMVSFMRLVLNQMHPHLGHAGAIRRV